MSSKQGKQALFFNMFDKTRNRWKIVYIKCLTGFIERYILYLIPKELCNKASYKIKRYTKYDLQRSVKK